MPSFAMAFQKEINSSALLTSAIAYYRFEADGTDTKGLINLKLSFAPSFNPGVFGNAIDFGTNNSTKYASTTPIGTAKPFTTTQLAAAHSTIFWLYLYSLPAIGTFEGVYEYEPNSDSNDASVEVLKYDNRDNVAYGSRCGNQGYPDTASIGLSVYNTVTTGGFISCSGVSLAINTWYNVAVVFNGTNYLFYINGMLRTSAPAVGTITTQFIGANQPGLRLGRERAVEYLSGKIDDFASFTSALTAAQITSVAESSALGIFNGKATLTNGKLTITN